MSAQDRLNWIRRGSPFKLIRPAAQLRDVLRAHGYTVYDIGNRAHLEHEPPEDHTPYSETGYPGQAKFGRGYAIDIMPPAAGRKSGITGKPLPSLAALGARMVADRKAGVAGISWLKYQNWEPEGGDGPCYKDAWRPSYRRTSSTDRGHIHQSGLTGFEDSTIGDDYDPVARIHGEDDDMPLTPADAKLVAKEFLATVLPDFAGIKGMSVRVALQNLVQQGHGPKFADWQATKNEAEIIALLKSLGGADTLEIVAEIRAQGEHTRAAILATIAELAPGLAAAIAARLDAIDESEIGEVLAQELAAMLGAAAVAERSS